MKKLYLYTDGSSIGNPGAAGIAYLLKDESGQVIASDAEPIGNATNNQAEYRAFLRGLAQAVAAGANEIEWFSDSQLLVRQWTGEYKIKDAHLRRLMQDAKALTNGVQVIPHAVPRNSTIEMERVDAWARKAALAQRKARQSRNTSR